MTNSAFTVAYFPPPPVENHRFLGAARRRGPFARSRGCRGEIRPERGAEVSQRNLLARSCRTGIPEFRELRLRRRPDAIPRLLGRSSSLVVLKSPSRCKRHGEPLIAA